MLSVSWAGRRRDVPWLTAAVCALCVTAFGVAASGLPLPGVTGEGAVDFGNALHVVGLGGRSTPLVADAGESWRMLTCHFVHTSWLHVLFNVAFLFSVGGALEHVCKRSDYAALLIACGISSALASLLGTPQVSAGASGLVFGVLGAAVSFGFRRGRNLGLQVRRYFGPWVLPFLLVLFSLGVGNAGVDHASHLGGLVAGLVGGIWLPLRNPAEVRVPGQTRTPAPLLLAGLFGALVVLSSPMLVGAGQVQRLRLETNTEVSVPRRWKPRFGPLGELEVTTAGGMVVLSFTRIPSHRRDDPEVWYQTHRLGALEPSGRVEGLRRIATSDLRTANMRGTWVRYRLRRDATEMTRDVHFVVDPGTGRTTVVALETPTVWVRKYRETRLAIVGSITSRRQNVTRAATTAPQGR